MQLDFDTLYVMGVANALSIALVWAFTCRSYRWLAAARFWLAGCLLIALGAGLLVSWQVGEPLLLLHLGLLSVTAGIGCFWMGVRRFDRQPVHWSAVGSIIGLTVAGLVFAGPDVASYNLVHLTGQTVMLALCFGTVMRIAEKGLGARLAAGSILFLIAAYATLLTLNGLVLNEIISESAYDDVAPWFVALIVLMLNTVSLGFLLMTTDTLRARLSTLATRDALTGLYNRRGFRERAWLCAKSARRAKADVIVMMIDLDSFKIVNDRHGHAVGDGCLVHIASLAQAVLRETDTIARLGDDEFCVLMPKTSMPYAMAIAERLRKAVGATPFQEPFSPNAILLSVSIGLTCWTPADGEGIDDILARADRAMYGTKQNGRNGYTVAAGNIRTKPPLIAGAA